jgi:hypothetical protein
MQIEPLEVEIVISEVKMTFAGISGRRKKISEPLQ